MIIGLTGRIAAGKETLTSFLREKGFIYLETSKLLSEELIKRGIEVNRTNQQNLGDEWRKIFGPGALMKKFLEKIDPGKNYIIDSLRNHHEAEFLRACGIKFFLIAVDAPQKLRFDRIIRRAKPSDPKTWEEFLITDNRDFDSGDDLGQNVKKCMEAADFIIMNDDDLKNSMGKIKEIWEKISKDSDIKIGGKYQHYKGGICEVIALGKHSETLEEVVIYKHENSEIWVRPKKMFLEKIEIPRFKLIE